VKLSVTFGLRGLLLLKHDREGNGLVALDSRVPPNSAMKKSAKARIFGVRQHFSFSSIFVRHLHRNSETCLYAIHHDHCLESLDIRILIEKPPRELLVILHRA